MMWQLFIEQHASCIVTVLESADITFDTESYCLQTQREVKVHCYSASLTDV